MAKVVRKDGPGAKQLEVMLQNLADKQAKVGFVDSTKYEDGTPVAYVAAIQEFGDGPIPPRPFMRTTVARDTPKWRELSQSGAKAIAKGSSSTETVLDALGMHASAGIRKSISQVHTPPLSPVTLRLRFLKREGEMIGGKVVGQAYRDVHFVGPRPKGEKLKLSANIKPLVFDGILIGAVTSVTEPAK
jgi:hypothetical protein